MAVGALHDRVPPLQRGGGRQRPQPGGGVRQRVHRAVQAVGQAADAALAQRGDLGRPLVDHEVRTGQHRPRPQRVDPVLLAVEQAGHRAVQPGARHPDQAQLLGEVRDQPLRRVGRRRRAYVRDIVDQRRVGLVPDRGDHRGAAGEDRAAERLVGEGQQVLDAAAAAGQHDHVDRGVLVEYAQRVDHLAHRARTLHRHVDHPELDRWPAPARVGQDVPLGRAGPASDQSDPAGQERRPALARRVEQALRGEQLLQPFQSGQQLAEADLPDLVGAQAQRAASGVELRFRVQDYPGALGEVGRAEIEDVPVGSDGEAEVGRRVAEGEEDGGRTRPPGDLGDLAVHPDPAQPADPGADLLADHPDRPRLLGRGPVFTHPASLLAPSSGAVRTCPRVRCSLGV